jgi:hypothetical protein
MPLSGVETKGAGWASVGIASNAGIAGTVGAGAAAYGFPEKAELGGNIARAAVTADC